jgi:hypothetical protein
MAGDRRRSLQASGGTSDGAIGVYRRQSSASIRVPRFVLSMTAPVVTRDSTGATIIRVGEHVIRLYRAP